MSEYTEPMTRRSERMRTSFSLLVFFSATQAACGASEHTFVDVAMTSAYRPDRVPLTALAPNSPAPAALAAPALNIYAGDLHCHVVPPDDASHVVRGVTETDTLARAEHLDFVVLTPHVGARFFQDDEARAWVSQTQRMLKNRIAALPAGGPIMVPGFEYTDYEYGHVGAAFADVDDVLGDVPLDAAREHPGRFFERWVARGGTLVVNHPLVTPIDAPISMARADISWRPFTQPAGVPQEIMAVHTRAIGFEAYNLTATHLRDRYLQLDTDRTFIETMSYLDRAAAREHRKLAAVGGTDSHSHHLRATTFVLATERSAPAFREALVRGRVCVRDPAACSFRVRDTSHTESREGAWSIAGDSLEGTTRVEVMAETPNDKDVAFLVNGEVSVRPVHANSAFVAVPGNACTVLRARVGRGYSGAVYVNCGF